LIVREMRPEDVGVCTVLGMQLHQEGYFSDLDFDKNKMFSVWQQIEQDNFCGFVAVDKNGDIAGLFVGLVCEHWFGKDLLASDLTLYVTPFYRGTSAAMRLLKAYEKWAKAKGAKVISLGVSTGITAERTGKFYERMGFNDVGKFYRRRS